MSSTDRYAQRGVSSGKEDVHKAIASLDKGLYPKAFCKVVADDLTGSPVHCLVMHADGAGTKSSLAYAYWKATGDLSVWHGIAQDAIVMNLDDLLCVGATDNILLSSTIGRNKRLIPGEVVSALIEGTELFLAKMRDLGIGIRSTGGETADVGDLVRTVIVDSTVVCRMKRDEVIDNARIQAGDVIVALASSAGRCAGRLRWPARPATSGGRRPSAPAAMRRVAIRQAHRAGAGRPPSRSPAPGPGACVPRSCVRGPRR